MKKTRIILSSIDDIKSFVAYATAQSCAIDLMSGRYTVDGKSIMGIFSLDLSSPIEVIYYGNDSDADSFFTIIDDFKVKD
ncbi:MAG: HPr family phosphocarrier protein [Clostridiales bacterium]|nr:HPr family phosphocarrier protein [Clostridiales bacterium]